MPILELVQHAIISVLVAYLSFANTFAYHIESLFGIPSWENRDTASIPEIQENALEKVAETKKDSIFSQVLLEHPDFQRAAVLASKKPDDNTFIPTEISLDTLTLNSLVNIYCQYKTDTYIRTTTGTGFFINPKGVILTNAHVAQFLLLEHNENIKGTVECIVRSDNPAKPKYFAKLLYISPRWIFENSTVITQESPQGTGERDYALLYIAKSIDNEPLPAQFPAIPIDTSLLTRSTEGISVRTAGYPAEALMRNGADATLKPVIASTTVGTLYTFGSNYADLFSISESPVGEHGASGGPIIHTTSKNAIGIIVTKGDPQTEGEKSLRALTLSYVDRTMQEETGFSLTQNMQGDVAYRGFIFSKAMAPFLAGILAEELSQ